MDSSRTLGLRRLAERYTAAWCSQDPERVASFYASSGSLTINGGEPAVGRAAIADSAQSFMTAFPDLVVSMDGLIERGERAVYRWTLTGTNRGPGGTGRRVRVSGFEDWRIGGDGLVVESLGYFDGIEYQRQLDRGAPEAPSLAEASSSIAETNAALDRALVDGSPEEAASHFTYDAVLGESGMVDGVGRAEITSFLTRGNEVRAVTYHLIHRDELVFLGTRAIEFGWFDETKVPHGKVAINERGRIVTDWRLESDGAWRIARLVISDLPAG